MATIVLGIGCAHTPQLHTPAEQWEIRAQRDMTDGVPLWFHGERLKYKDVEAARKHEALAEQTAMEVREERLRKSFEAVDVLAPVAAVLGFVEEASVLLVLSSALSLALSSALSPAVAFVFFGSEGSAMKLSPLRQPVA